jgi:hypothetical protein
VFCFVTPHTDGTITNFCHFTNTKNGDSSHGDMAHESTFKKSLSLRHKLPKEILSYDYRINHLPYTFNKRTRTVKKFNTKNQVNMIDEKSKKIKSNRIAVPVRCNTNNYIDFRIFGSRMTSRGDTQLLCSHNPLTTRSLMYGKHKHFTKCF